MILSTLAAMADRENNGRLDLNASRADILKIINDLSAAGKLNIISEKLTIGDQIRMGRTNKAFAIAAEALERKYAETEIADEIINLQFSSSSSSSYSSYSCSSSSNSSSSYSSSSYSSSSNSSCSCSSSSNSSSSYSSSSYSSSSYSSSSHSSSSRSSSSNSSSSCSSSESLSSSSSSCSSSSEAETFGLSITVSWLDEDINKTLLGETWTNGQTKVFEPTSYESNASKEVFNWTNPLGGEEIDIFDLTGGQAGFNVQFLDPDIGSAAKISRFISFGSPAHVTTNIGSVDPDLYMTNNFVFNGKLGQKFFGFVVSDSGITVAWEKSGSGWKP